MLAILVQTKTGTSNLASTLVTFDNNTVAGNSIVVIGGNSSTTSGDISGVTDSQGNVYVKDITTANATVGEVEIWHTSGIIGGANTVTVAYTTGVACAVIIREYSGLLYSSSINKTAGTTGNSSALNSGNTTALTQNTELLIGAGLIPLANTFSAGGSFVNLVSVGAPLVVAVAAEDLLVTTGGVQAATFTANASVQWVCVIATFFLSPTGTTTSTSSTSASTISTSSTSSSLSTSSTSFSSTSTSASTSSTSTSFSITTLSTSSTSSSTSSTSISSTSSSTSISSTSSSVSSTSQSSTSLSSTSSSTSFSSTSTSFSSTSSSQSSTSFSTSSTSFSSTSSSSSTSSTTLPPPFIDYSYQDSASVDYVLQFGVRSPTTWVCPVGVTSVLAECWGGGGGGGGGGAALANSGGGGGGGAYSNKTITVTPGTSYTISVGTSGTAGSATGPTAGGNGGDTSFVNSATLLAKGGLGGGAGTPTQGAGGAGGTAGSGVGTVTTSGGAGADGNSNGQAGGGGGAGGSSGTGAAGDNITGAGGASGGPMGGSGGTNQLGGHTPGGGGAGGDQAANGAAGAGGMVQLTYTSSALPTTGADLSNPFIYKNYTNVTGDDGDYFIEYGSEYMIRNYQRKNTNSTDKPQFTWRGRSTVSTITSPILIQIYNVNSSAWETLAVVNKIPADTDFSATVIQSSNTSNYYDSNNYVTFRSYQLII